jgi:drug/metabolite transporter (DMT)-like permease
VAPAVLAGLTNTVVWHVLLMFALQSLSSGRAAILGYTMPIFSAVIGALWYGDRLPPRMTVLAVVLERPQWKAPGATTWNAILYNGILIFGFAQPAWFYLARSLPPVASTLSVMFIPVLGVFSGALWLGEVLHWQDWAAVVLMVAAIASVLWPARPVAAAA